MPDYSISMSPTRAAADEASRLKLQDTLHQAAESMETPNDMMLRLFNTSLEVATIKSGYDMGLFKRLASSDKPLSTAQLAQETGAETAFLGRILRYLAATRSITETGKDEFSANLSTRSLAEPAIEGSLHYIFEIAGPAYQGLPAFMKETKYRTPPGTQCAWQRSVGTDKDFFPFMKDYPDRLGWFQSLMSVPRDGDWLDVVPFAVEAANVASERALFVDVGGSIGHQSRRLKDKYPNLPGRVICQDLEETVKVAPPCTGLEFMAYDFFTPQPVKDARFYYLRTVLHDWDEENSVKILQNTAAAMGPDSQILIDEMALPATGVHWWSACLDLHMYTMLNALERTVDQWQELLDKADLKIVEVRPYALVMRHSIIVVERK